MSAQILEAQFESIEKKEKPFRTDQELRVARRIFKFRIEKGLTQEQLSKKLTITRTTIVNWESGNFPVSIAHLSNLANALDKHISEFFTE